MNINTSWTVIGVTVGLVLSLIIVQGFKAQQVSEEAQLNYKAKLAAYGCSDYNGAVVCPVKSDKDDSYDR
jgi:hypothetical protein